MFTFKQYVLAESLEEAYMLNQKSRNRILGGCGWMKMSNKRLQTAIDLSALGLNQIEETEEAFIIGCMCTLRQLETDTGLDAQFQGAFAEALHPIVGVQFRNCVTVGGSVYQRFGFSDVLTLLLALDTEIEMYHDGKIALEDFIQMPYNNDILVRIHVKKTHRQVAYLSHRNTATDFPVLACCVSRFSEKSDREEAGWRIAVGARPMRAKLVTDVRNTQKPDVDDIVSQLSFGSNRRGSAEYREHLAHVLLKQAMKTVTSYPAASEE